MGKYERATGVPLWRQVGDWFAHIRFTEPAMLRGTVIAVLTAAAAWGYDYIAEGERAMVTYGALFAVVQVAQAWWTRTVVSPSNECAPE